MRSSLAAEALSLQTALEDGVFHRALIQEIFGHPLASISINAFVDSKGVVEAIHSTKLVGHPLASILISAFVDSKGVAEAIHDISAIKQSMDRNEVHSIKWYPGAVQLANCLTKRGAQSRDLLVVLQSGKLLLQMDWT